MHVTSGQQRHPKGGRKPTRAEVTKYHLSRFDVLTIILTSSSPPYCWVVSGTSLPPQFPLRGPGNLNSAGFGRWNAPKPPDFKSAVLRFCTSRATAHLRSPPVGGVGFSQDRSLYGQKNWALTINGRNRPIRPTRPPWWFWGSKRNFLNKIFEISKIAALGPAITAVSANFAIFEFWPWNVPIKFPNGHFFQNVFG